MEMPKKSREIKSGDVYSYMDGIVILVQNAYDHNGDWSVLSSDKDSTEMRNLTLSTPHSSAHIGEEKFLFNLSDLSPILRKKFLGEL